MTEFYEAIIWSLVAELVYYTVYPALRGTVRARPRILMVIAYSVAFALIATHPGALNFHEFGPWLTWLVGLPSWLLGCRLASWAVADKSGSTTSPWFWRGAVWAASSFASVLRFHANIGYPLTLSLFGILVFFWLREEIRYYRLVKPPVSTEYCGRWSYSIYLVHGLAAIGFARLAFRSGPVLLWLLQTMAVVACSFFFFLAVELPSHRLARYLARVGTKPAIPDAASLRSL